jgi:uncharacterized membrane protein
MFGRSRSAVLKENAAAASELASQAVADRKFRKKLVSAAGHGVRAQEEVRRQLGLIAVARALAADERFRRELVQMIRDLRAAWSRVEKKRSHRLRNSLLVVGGAGGAAAAAGMPQSRQWLADRLGDVSVSPSAAPRAIESTIEVDAPVAAAYNQWTQFEEFPQFMEGVEQVRQLDDTRLHWVVSVGGKRAEWDAKILEQHPEQQISWISEDGKKNRGTVTFQPREPSRTLVRLSMSYQAEGLRERLGSAAGVDRRRVHGDLERFKQLIESRSRETGAWRGEISEGTEVKKPRRQPS